MTPMLERETDLPEGSVVPVDGEPLLFGVKGSRDWYLVRLADDTHLPRCSCPDHCFRHLGTLTPCKHLLLVAEYVEAMKKPATCPCCGQTLP